MTLVQTVKTHQANTLKVFLVVIATVIFLFSLQSWANSNKVTNQQQIQANTAIENHTKTINEIQQAVNELKTNNATDHQQTIKYINCVLVGITEAPGRTEALSVYQTCLTNSNIPVTTGN